MSKWSTTVTLIILISTNRGEHGPDTRRVERLINYFSASQSYYDKQTKLEKRLNNLQKGINMVDNFLGSVKVYSVVNISIILRIYVKFCQRHGCIKCHLRRAKSWAR